MSVTSLIKRFGQSIILTRDIEGTIRVKGKSVPGKTEDFTIRASVQPMRPDETLEDREGERNRHWIRLYSVSEMKSVDEKNSLKGDLVTYLNDKYEIQRVNKWVGNNRNLQHYKAEAVLVNE